MCGSACSPKRPAQPHQRPSVLPAGRHALQLLFLQFVLGGTLVLPLAPARGLHVAPANQASRLGAARCAYNPQPSKSKPRKAKVKGPKEKGPPSAAAALQLVPEITFFEGPPSITETFIPGLSLFTVVGVIPFSASLARQAWTRYKLTNKRLEISSGALLLLPLPLSLLSCTCGSLAPPPLLSAAPPLSRDASALPPAARPRVGFQGKDVVQVVWREIVDIKWLRRFGGQLRAPDSPLPLAQSPSAGCRLAWRRRRSR